MRIIDNITNDNHYSEIKESSSLSDEILIVSPFCFSDFKYFFDHIVKRSSIKSISLITTLRRNEIATKIYSLQSFHDTALSHGVESKICINDSLHGKIYLFKSGGINTKAIITSANITHNGLHNNHEWGCVFSDKDTIDNLEKAILSTVEYNLTETILGQIKEKVDDYKRKNPITNPSQSPSININDIIIPHRFSVDIDSGTRLFLKPIGSTENPVYDGDYSNEPKQYFSKKRPIAVRKNDLLISYAVGARKIVSIFKVLSDYPLSDINNERWPWYFNVENITPKFGENWFDQDLYITDLARKYVEIFDSNITNVGGQTLGALQRGVDKIRLDQDFGVYLMSKIMDVEQTL